MLELGSNQPITGQSIADLQEKLPHLSSVTIDSPQFQMQ